MRTANNTNNGPATRWYLVANRTDAIIYQDADNKKFQPVEHLLNSEGNKKERDLDSDRPGRSFSNGPGRYTHPMTSELQRHEDIARKFSHRICETLESARATGQFDELVLVAEPKFLGHLNKALNQKLKKCIAYQLPREYMDTDRKLRSKILSAIKAGVTH